MGYSDLAPLGVSAVREAVRFGFPVYAKRLTRDVVLVRNERGKGVLFFSLIEAERRGLYYLAAGMDKFTVWKHYVALLRDGDSVVEYYPYNVVKAVAGYAVMFTTFEIDVWYNRLLRLARGAYLEADTIPPILSEWLRENGVEWTRAVYLRDMRDYAVFRDNVVVAWFNEFTESIYDARPWLAGMGLL